MVARKPENEKPVTVYTRQFSRSRVSGALVVPWSVLFLSAALLWPPPRAVGRLALAVAYAWAGTQGALDPAALAAPALLALAALLVQPAARPPCGWPATCCSSPWRRRCSCT